MISTRRLDALPGIATLRRLTRSLAMLDAIMSPEWESRYYSFDSHWGPGEMMASMRNGQGPAFDARNCTFCIWRRSAGARWEHGPVEFPRGDDPDGSAQLLAILDGRPESYRAFAADYYEVDLPLDAVAALYAHQPLTPTPSCRSTCSARTSQRSDTPIPGRVRDDG